MAAEIHFCVGWLPLQYLIVAFRCYNCSEYGTHIAARCPLEKQEKRCHICKSDQHLVASCPQRQNRDSRDDPDAGGQRS